jgi:hypothetical protein
MKTTLIAFFILFIGLYAVAKSPFKAEDENEKFIQGTWRLTGENGGHGWFLEWTFDHGKFDLKGYPPLYQGGKYRIIKTEGNKMTLELYDQDGNFGTENSQIEIVVDKEKDKLMIKGQGPFERRNDEPKARS